MIILLISLIVAILAWVSIIWFAQRLFIYPGTWSIPASMQVKPDADVRVIHVKTPAGPVEGWFLQGDDVTASHPGPAVIYAHGNGELIDFWQRDMAGYTRLGVSVLLVEYPGYGRSAGSPTQTTITRAMIDFHDWLAAQPVVDLDRIIYHGRSLGGGVIAALARHRPPAAMILESTFTSIPDVARSLLVPGFLIRDRYNTLGYLRTYDGPVLILHGKNDRTIAPHLARELHHAAPQSTLIFYNTDHNTLPPPRQYWTDIEHFLEAAHMIQGEVVASPME